MVWASTAWSSRKGGLGAMKFTGLRIDFFVETTDFFAMVAGNFDKFILRPGASGNVSG